ncbi:hypothetical protein RIT80_11500, partial [Streptococcus pneumoniae]|nr:hypothetical protein [Streptococcus pneumoniae]
MRLNQHQRLPQPQRQQVRRLQHQRVRNFENFKKRIFIALNIKKERTKFVLSFLIFRAIKIRFLKFSK